MDQKASWFLEHPIVRVSDHLSSQKSVFNYLKKENTEEALQRWESLGIMPAGVKESLLEMLKPYRSGSGGLLPKGFKVLEEQIAQGSQKLERLVYLGSAMEAQLQCPQEVYEGSLGVRQLNLLLEHAREVGEERTFLEEVLRVAVVYDQVPLVKWSLAQGASLPLAPIAGVGLRRKMKNVTDVTQSSVLSLCVNFDAKKVYEYLESAGYKRVLNDCAPVQEEPYVAQHVQSSEEEPSLWEQCLSRSDANGVEYFSYWAEKLQEHLPLSECTQEQKNVLVRSVIDHRREWDEPVVAAQLAFLIEHGLTSSSAPQLELEPILDLLDCYKAKDLKSTMEQWAQIDEKAPKSVTLFLKKNLSESKTRDPSEVERLNITGVLYWMSVSGQIERWKNEANFDANAKWENLILGRVEAQQGGSLNAQSAFNERLLEILPQGSLVAGFGLSDPQILKVRSALIGLLSCADPKEYQKEKGKKQRALVEKMVESLEGLTQQGVTPLGVRARL